MTAADEGSTSPGSIDRYFAALDALHDFVARRHASRPRKKLSRLDCLVVGLRLGEAAGYWEAMTPGERFAVLVETDKGPTSAGPFGEHAPHCKFLSDFAEAFGGRFADALYEEVG